MLYMGDNNSTPPAGTDTIAPFGFTFGDTHTQAEWSDFRRLTWPDLVKKLTSHVPGPKEGSCIVPAKFSGTTRTKKDAVQVDVAFLDSDSGATLSEIRDALTRTGWEAVVSSTHSHMATTTKVKIVNWDRFFTNTPNATAAEFLVHEKGYLPRVAESAKAVSTDGDYITIEHQQCPKFRIAIPLERPWRAADYPNQDAANAAWKERIEALAAALNLDHDQACTDTSRLFYLPRRPANGVVPETAIVTGAHCDIFALPAAATIQHDDLLSPHRAKPKQDDSDTKEFIDPIHGEVLDAVQWAKDYGPGFLIAKALKARKPGVLTGHVSDGKVHIDCPNASKHTHAERDGATFVSNGGPGSRNKGGFAIHCRHAHCEGMDRVTFVKMMLEQGWLDFADLKDAAYQAKTEDTKPASEAVKSPLPLLWFDEIDPVLDARDFVQGVLLEEGAVVVYGESNAGKTFWSTDLSLHVAAGMDWCGRRVEQGGVIYCVLEGGIGFRNRVAAWKADKDLAGQSLPFVAIPSGLNLLDPEADTPRLIAAIQAVRERMGVPVKLVVIDTLSRAMAGGNENAPDDMGALVQNMDTIRSETGCCVMFIHHSGKDQAKGARGHSLLRAAIDTEIEVVAGEGTEKTATIVKQREMKKGDQFGFTLRVVELGANRHTEQVTTCIVDYGPDGPQGAATRPVPHRKLTGHNKRALEVLSDLIAASGRTGERGVPSGCSSVPEKWWRDRFYASALPGAEAATKTRTFDRVSKELIGTYVVGMDAGRVWIVRNDNLQTGQKSGFKTYEPDKSDLSGVPQYRNDSEGEE